VERTRWYSHLRPTDPDVDVWDISPIDSKLTDLYVDPSDIDSRLTDLYVDPSDIDSQLYDPLAIAGKKGVPVGTSSYLDASTMLFNVMRLPTMLSIFLFRALSLLKSRFIKVLLVFPREKCVTFGIWV
jgi:hypothetical protein